MDSNDSSVSFTPSYETFEEYLKAVPSLAPRTKERWLILYKRFTKLGYQHDIGGIMRYLNKYPSNLTKPVFIYYAKYKKDKELLSELRELKVKTPAPKPREIPTYEEFIKVINSLGREEQLIARFLLNTGARIHEAFTLLCEDLKDDGTVILRTKGGKYRTVALTDKYFNELRYYIKEIRGVLAKDYIFYDRKNTKLETKRVRFWVKLNRTARRIIHKTIPTHDFRRFTGTFLYEQTHDIEFVRRILGHADISTTHRYTQYASAKHDIRTAKEILSKLESPQNTTETERA